MITLKTKQLENGTAIFASDETKKRYNIRRLGEERCECACCLVSELVGSASELYEATENETLNPQDNLEE